jgi:TolA-binding protein
MATETWRSLLARGDVDEALTNAESSGQFDDACASVSASDLMLWGESARAAGQSARALHIYQAVRDRFPASDFAANAAFHLGQVAFDQRASVDEARRWFSTYLGERPNGSLAQQALGRLIEVEQRAGARSSARSLAERYLERFPDGPHAPLARALASP